MANFLRRCSATLAGIKPSNPVTLTCGRFMVTNSTRFDCAKNIVNVKKNAWQNSKMELL